jgi:hypothetical protein
MRIRVAALALSAALLSSGLAAAPAAAAPDAAAPAARLAAGQPSTGLAAGSSLSGVAVLSPRNAWAVGYDNDNNGGLLAHWNGTRWSYTVLKNIGGISAITAISPSDIWAVGGGVILHWNGSKWSLAKYPAILFNSVGASSASNVWAGGTYSADSAPDPENAVAALLHWTGKKWSVVPLQSPKGNVLQQVSSLAVTGPKSAWASMYVSLSGGDYILMHWNGSVWRPLTTPVPGGASNLVLATSVVAGPRDSAWAFGWTTAVQSTPQIMYWNGKSWRNDSGSLGQQADYSDACFEANGTGWAMGNQQWGETETGISRWTGKAWTASPVKVTGTEVYGGLSPVACGALSNSYAWAVGTFSTSPGYYYSLILHWNGKIWS